MSEFKTMQDIESSQEKGKKMKKYCVVIEGKNGEDYKDSEFDSVCDAQRYIFNDYGFNCNSRNYCYIKIYDNEKWNDRNIFCFDDEVIIMSYPLEEIIFKRAEKEYSENFTSIMNAYLDIIISVYSKKESFLNNYKEEVIKEFQWRMKKYLQRDDIEPNYYEVLLEFLKEYTIDKIERIS